MSLLDWPPWPHNGEALWALVCTDDETSTLLDAGDALTLCGPSYNLSSICTASAAMRGPNATSWDLSIPSVAAAPASAGGTLYNALLLGCYDGFGVDVEASWEWVNPGGQQLSTSQIPLLALTQGFGVAWSVAVSLFLLVAAYAAAAFRLPAEWAALRGSPDDPAAGEAQLGKAVRPLHAALLLPPLLMALSCFVSLTYWGALSRTGVDDALMSIVDSLCWDLAGASIVGLVLAVGRGWQVTRLRLLRAETRQIATLTLTFVLAQASFQLVGGFFFLFLVVLLYVLLVRFLFASVSWSLHLLQTFRSYALGLARANREDGGEGGDGAAGSEEEAAALYGGGGGGAARPVPTYGTPTAAGSQQQQQRQQQPQGLWARTRAAAGAAAQSAGAAVSSALGVGSGRSAAPVAAGRGVYRPLDGDEDDEGGEWGADGSPTRGRGGARRGGASAEADSPGTLYDGGLTERQLSTLRYYRSAVVAYLSLRLFLDLYGSLQSSTLTTGDGSGGGAEVWVSYLLQQLLVLTLLTSLLWVFRPRADPTTSPLYDPRGYVAGSTESLLGAYDGDGVDAGEDVAGGGGGRRSPRAPRPPPRSSTRQFVVVNPDSVDETGKATVGPVTIAERVVARGPTMALAPTTQDDDAGGGGGGGGWGGSGHMVLEREGFAPQGTTGGGGEGGGGQRYGGYYGGRI